jgi:starch phosphorylase
VPVEWFRRVKRALRTLGWRYNSDRMVMDYARLAYVPASGTGTAHVIG